MKLPGETISRYDGVTQSIHWMTAILVVVAFIFGPGGSERHAYSAARDFDRQLHETLGLIVIGLTLLRIIWHQRGETPAPPPSNRWVQFTAKGVKALLYFLLLGVPLTAITSAWLQGHPLTLLAGMEIPSLVNESHALGTTFAKIHTMLGDVIIWIAGLHAAAALYHHYALKDDVLCSMLPHRPRNSG